MKQVTALFIIALMCISIFAIGSVTAQPTEKTPVIITFNDTPDAQLIKANGGNIKHQYTIIPAIAAELPLQAIDALSKNPKISKIEPDGKFHATQTELQWGVDRIDAEKVHHYNTGEGVKVAVIDTGIDYTHPDLDANFGSVKGTDIINNDQDPMDDNGHGTHCAGIIAAEANAMGVIGVAPSAQLFAVKVLDASGGGYESDVIAGINWAVNNGADIISMSLGSDGASTALETACNNAYDAGLLIVAAAGNDYRGNKRVEWDTVDYPGRFDSVIAVAATDQNDAKASFSSTGPDVEIVAPGVSIVSTYLGGYATGSGTSMATPHVAGVAALIIAQNPNWSPSQVRSQLQITADDLGASGTDYWYGYGLVDADEAAPNTTPDETPPPQVTGLHATYISSSRIDLSWNEINEEPIADYKIYRDGEQIAISTISSFSDTGLSPQTTYSYTVSAVDLANNEGEKSVAITETTDEAPSTQVLTVQITEITLETRNAGKNTFYSAKATVLVTDGTNPLSEATVQGYWTGATADTDIAVTDGNGLATISSDELKNPGPGTTFTLTIGNVILEGYSYDSENPISASKST